MNAVTPVEIRRFLEALAAAGSEAAVIVGGQAVNLWAEQYRTNSAVWRRLQPFASEDLDCLGGRVELLALRDQVGGRVKLNRDFDPAPQTGLLLLPVAGGTFRVDFLGTVFGLNAQEVLRTAQVFMGARELRGLRLRVLHPVLCLESKTACLAALPQRGRQDEKHVRLSLLIVRAFLREHLAQPPRPTLRLIERLVTSATGEHGLAVWWRHGLRLEQAIPLAALRRDSRPLFGRFLARRWPQIQQHLRDKRARYRAIMQRIHPC